MRVESDYKDLLRILNKHKVRYLIIGAYAAIYYTVPRYSKDLDICVEPEIKNAGRVFKSLKEFGAPLKGIEPADFTNKNSVYQIGVAPVRVDVMMGMPGIEFERAWKHRKIATFDGIRVNILGINELIKSKKNTKRPVDLVDIENLENSLKLKSKMRRR